MCLHYTTRQLNEMPTLASEFLEKKARGKLNLTHTTFNSSSETKSETNGKKTLTCYHCQGNNTMFQCNKFKEMSANDRLICSSPNHQANSESCKSDPCERCNRGSKHNSLLCNTTTMTTRAINSQAGDALHLSQQPKEIPLHTKPHIGRPSNNKGDS